MTYRTYHNSLKFLNYIKFKNRSGTFLTPCTLLLDIFITGYILNEYITIGYIYRCVYSQQVHYYWIYLSLNIFSMSTLLLDIFITANILNEYIIIRYIYNWIYSQSVHYY